MTALSSARRQVVRRLWPLLGALFLPLLVGGTVGIRVAFGFQPGDPPITVLLLFPVAVGAWLGGLAAGLFASALSAMAAWMWLVDVNTALWPVQVMALLVAGSLLSAAVNRARQPAPDPALRAALERLNLFVEHAPAAIALFDREMRYVAVSRRFVQDYGIEGKTVLGRSHYEIFPEIPQRWKDIHQRCLAGAVESCEEDPFPRADGGLDWVHWEIRPWRDAQGNIGGIVLFSEVITERKRMKDERDAAHRVAREEQERLAVTLRSIGDAVIATNAAGVITLTNPTADAITGMPAARALGQNVDDVFRVVDETTLQPCESPVRRALRDATTVTLPDNVVLLRQDGTRCPVADSAAPIRDGEGNVLGAVLVFRDQTRQRAADKARVDHETQLARIAAAVPGCIYAFRLRPDGTSCMPFTTPAVEDLFGVSQASLAQDLSGWGRNMEKDEAARVMASIDDAARAMAAWHACYRYQHPTKGQRWIEGWSIPVREEDGSILWHGFAADVSETRQAQEGLQRSEQRFRTLFENAGVGMAEVDSTTGTLLQVNESFARLLGYSAQEMMALRWQDLTHPDDLARDEQAVRQMRDNGQPYTREKRYRRKDGSSLWAQLTVAPMWDPGAAPLSQVAVIQDVTARKDAEAAVEQGAQRFRALIERATDLVVVLDVDLKVTFWSPSGQDLTGWTAGEVLGRHFGQFMHPEDATRAGDEVGRLRTATGATARIVTRVLCKDGSERVMEVSARNLLQDPAVRGIVGNARDITEQRRLTEQFHQAQRLESVGRLAGGVAHDFNNLLTVILSCSDTLRKSLAEAPVENREDVEQIRESAERAAGLTRQLLAFARKQVIEPVSLDLNTVVRGAQRMLGRLLGEDIRLEVNLAAVLWNIHADPGQMEQVIVNLAVNARDAMPTGGILTLETFNVRAAGPGTADRVKLVVRDNGAGMTPEVRAHLFEPFFTTKPQGKGTGLGLATVYGIVSQAGGEVHVESTPGRGAAFELTFPRSVEQAAAEPRPAAAPRGGTETILVVEDDPQVRQMMARWLSRAGYNVLLAPSGNDAVDLARRHAGPIHLVVSDVVMPGMNGKALQEALHRTLRPPPPVLFVSGYTDDIISRHGVVLPGVELLAKPLRGPALLGRVRDLLDAHGGPTRPAV